MARKFMSIKTIVIPMISLIVMTSQLLGTSIVASAEMVKMIDSGQEVSIEVSQPYYEVKVQGQQQSKLEWVQLDQLKTYNGFRQDFDSTLNINTVTEKGVNGKSGCIYVDDQGERSGNTTIFDAFRNKTFINKYWNDKGTKDKLIKLGSKAYTDVDGNEEYSLAGTLNAYFNLIPNGENPNSFNPTQSMTREQFYSMLYRAVTPVQVIQSDSSFENAVGGKTGFTDYAQGIDEKGFLNVNNKSLDRAAYTGSISRAEAVYMIVNSQLQSELSKVNGSEKAFDDTKNAGDLALKAGFKTKNSDGTILGKDRWQAYTLAYMMQHPDDGMQDELYRAMVVAKNVGIITSTESRWDEPISNSEAIMMVANTALALNKVSGFKSEAEYGKTSATKFEVATETNKPLGTDEDGTQYGKGWAEASGEEDTADPNKVLSSGMTLLEAQQSIQSTVNRIKSMGESVEDNMDLINNQCKKMGTTYDEILKLPELATQPRVQEKIKRETVTGKRNNNVEKPSRENYNNQSNSQQNNNETRQESNSSSQDAPTQRTTKSGPPIAKKGDHTNANVTGTTVNKEADRLMHEANR